MVFRLLCCKKMVLGFVVFTLCFGIGCRSSEKEEVVLFCALDREFSQQRLDEFEEESKIHPVPKFDTESSKTVGLANLILKQGESGSTDVFWNNEILHTLRIQKAGLTLPLEIEGMDRFPEEFRSKKNDWFGFAARARVFIINTKRLPKKEEWPSKLIDLVDPKNKGKVCMAKPLFGTTATHFAVLSSHWGKEKTESFLDKIKENQVAILSGNRQVAADVASGTYAFGITDTDDALVEIDAGSPVVMVFPDQEPDGIGSLLIPNTISVLKSAKNIANAKRLVEFALSEKNESALASGASGQIPLSETCSEPSRALTEAEIQRKDLRWMKVDWEKTVDHWAEIIPELKKRFL